MAQKRSRKYKKKTGVGPVAIAGTLALIVTAALALAALGGCRPFASSSSSPSSSSSVTVSSSEPASSLAAVISSRPSSSQRVSSAVSSEQPTVSVYSVSTFVGQSDDWRLLMSNRNNVISDYEPEVTRIPEEYCQDSQNYRIDSRVYDDLMAMIAAASEDGVKLTVVSSYRPYSSQERLYNNKVNYYINKGYSRANAERLASTVVAIPGTSDHNLGLAVDFNYLEQSDEDKPELVWLRENAEQFGFVMRYPEGKENVTGVIYEPWHYRYVGVEHAAAMNEQGLCLEEYVEQLSSN